jgi:phage baseplate assembly protein W
VTAPLMGWAFPFRIEPPGDDGLGGGIARAVDFAKVEANLRHLVLSRTGERVMLRGYGAGVHHRLQEPNTAPLRTLLRHEIEAALRRFMPEVTLAAPPALSAAGDRLTVVLTYAVRPRDVVRRLEVELGPGAPP